MWNGTDIDTVHETERISKRNEYRIGTNGTFTKGTNIGSERTERSHGMNIETKRTNANGANDTVHVTKDDN